MCAFAPFELSAPLDSHIKVDFFAQAFPAIVMQQLTSAVVQVNRTFHMAVVFNGCVCSA